MKKIIPLLSSLFLVGGFALGQETPAKPAASGEKSAGEVKVSADQMRQDAGYYFGYSLGRQLSNQAPGVSPSHLNMDEFIKGFKAALAGEEPGIPIERVRASLGQLEGELRAIVTREAKKNLAAGNAFLAENAKKPGVKTLPGGIQYKVITEGKGKLMEAPAKGKDLANYQCMVSYKGELLNGKVFDDSKGEAVPFPINQVIPGFKAVLSQMPVGSTWEVWIPANLAYGENSPGPSIPPNSALKFTLTLKDIKDPAPQAEGGAPQQISEEELRKLLEGAQQQKEGSK